MNFGKLTYQKIFSPYSNKRVGYLRLYGNWGDSLIEKACFELFRDFNIEVRIINPEIVKIDPKNLDGIDTVLMPGGGSYGFLYKHNYELRTKLCELFNNQIVFLPQSMTDDLDKNPYTKVWLREAQSFEKCSRPKDICHDLAFYLTFDAYKNIKPYFKAGFLCREDEEAAGKRPFNLGDPVKICRSVDEYIKLAASFEEIITDRIHFAIIAAKLGRKVHLFAGNYYKNKAIYEFSLRVFPNVTFYNSFVEILA